MVTTCRPEHPKELPPVSFTPRLVGLRPPSGADVAVPLGVLPAELGAVQVEPQTSEKASHRNTSASRMWFCWNRTSGGTSKNSQSAVLTVTPRFLETFFAHIEAPA